MSGPPWLRTLAATGSMVADPVNPITQLQTPPDADGRPASVLVLFGGDPSADRLPDDASVLLTQRASSLRQHSGQVAFPGGAADPGDGGAVGTALREATEETGLDATGVEPLATFDPIFVPPSGFEVTPVLAYWRTPGPVRVIDTAEVARVEAVPLAELLDPAHRFVVRHPRGYAGPAFDVRGMLVWGFTAGVLTGILDTAGWTVPWDTEDVRDLETALAAAGSELL